MDLREAVYAHAERFNDAVRSQDFTPFAETFAETAVMHFDGVPVGPFKGRSAVLKAYQAQPPDDGQIAEMTVSFE